MWLNCIFGGKGVGMINLLLFLFIGIFIPRLCTVPDAAPPG